MPDSRARILAIDDTPENLTLLVDLLQGDYDVRVATSGARALRLAEKDTPDLILLDIMMPEMDGFEVCRQIKLRPELQDVPVLFISALDRVEDKVSAFTSGGVDYITKPFQAEEVEARVATHLELRRQKRELQESYVRLSELEKLRDNLVHMVVHDLRSPLLGLSGCLQLLHGDVASTLETEQREDLESAMGAASTLSEMVTSLLDVNRLESGEMPLHRERADIGVILADALAGLGALTKGRQVLLEPPATSVMVNCDADVIRRITANLVANALKFTPRSGVVRLSVGVTSDVARVAVADDGPGIPESHRARIFEKFGQIEAQMEGRKNSTGLGLMFCKLATEAHNGSIGVDCPEAGGSVFWFELPVDSAV